MSMIYGGCTHIYDFPSHITHIHLRGAYMYVRAEQRTATFFIRNPRARAAAEMESELRPCRQRRASRP